PEGHGNQTYLSVIPFVAYGWVSVFLIPLVIMGVIPIFGKMKKAEQRAIEKGELIPGGRKMAKLKLEHFETDKKPHAIYFLLPLIVLLASTFALDLDALKGV